MMARILASVLVTWVTFMPCYLWIFLGALYIEKLRGNRSLNGALSAITAAVVGVVLNLAVWFALHTLFSTVGEVHSIGLRLFVPELSTISIPLFIIAGLSFPALLRFKLGVITVIAMSAMIGIAYNLLQ